jgi:hypothetical protein
VFGGVCVAGADVFVLEGFELLLRAEFVGLVGSLEYLIKEGEGEGLPYWRDDVLREQSGFRTEDVTAKNNRKCTGMVI